MRYTFRDNSDPKWQYDKLEVNEDIELLLNKIRMILITKRGEVMGEPELGLDLEDMLFDFTFDEHTLKQSFYAQLQKYVTEQDIYKIDLNITTGIDERETVIYLFVTINDVAYLGLQI